MIYISSACFKHQKIKDSVSQLANAGFLNIELTGGTKYYDGFEQDLLELKDKYNLNYLCHNYFPPPKTPFVVNIASLNDDVYQNSIDHFKSAINLSKQLGAKKFGFHAGFLIDIKVHEIGKPITKELLQNKEKSFDRFCTAFNLLKDASDDINLYIENNVISETNYKTYNGENFLMLTNYQNYLELVERLDFNLLLDVAHLKVSSRVLNLDFKTEISNMLGKSDYLHISDNDGLHDLNYGMTKDSELFKILANFDLSQKDFTLEVYSGLSALEDSFNAVTELLTV
ncbi:MAG: Xylose isomerase [Pseudomonadota bacterium]|nr:Xylose isomerase [Pseudomonadota bacterium]